MIRHGKCIKTGAWLFIDNYGSTHRVDIFLLPHRLLLFNGIANEHFNSEYVPDVVVTLNIPGYFLSDEILVVHELHVVTPDNLVHNLLQGIKS